MSSNTEALVYLTVTFLKLALSIIFTAMTSFFKCIIIIIIIIIIITDIAIPGDRNVIKKEAEKIVICKDLIIEIHRMWNVKSKVIPVITGGTGTVSKSLRQYLSDIPGKSEIRELQKNNHIVHCTQTARSDDVKVQITFHGRNNITCSTDCKYRTAATLYTLTTRFVSGI